jgi:hypothetical protein
MTRPIASGLAGIEAAAAVIASAARHAGWWLEWHARTGPSAGIRELADVELGPELPACESS